MRYVVQGIPWVDVYRCPICPLDVSLLSRELHLSPKRTEFAQAIPPAGVSSTQLRTMFGRTPAPRSNKPPPGNQLHIDNYWPSPKFQDRNSRPHSRAVRAGIAIRISPCGSSQASGVRLSGDMIGTCPPTPLLQGSAHIATLLRHGRVLVQPSKIASQPSGFLRSWATVPVFE